ncbi:hypothetical protein MVG78_15150 [Roseomonas gilardii subsp. gilardii]|uniref:hypothetical protein n=1 Tax=Roseomonas gilardii TaxID=257708 RepID=UPI001FF9ED61|nr:hypothetical protein [Roseomonas gilardii]UPG71862.1 hypothetical protein MVG78_15150 [Roseomonas gilardii subsp. gilardii]
MTGSAARILFDDGKLRVVFHPATDSLPGGGSRRGTLLTFADLTFRPDGMRVWGMAPARKLGLDLIGIVSHAPDWYPARSVEAAARAIRPFLDPHTVAYGYSMGAHAALKHARRLGVNHALAISPQYSIDAAVVPEDTRYAGYFNRKLHAGLRIDADELPPVPVIVADPYHREDGAQARAIMAAGLAHWVPAPFMEHWAIHLLRSSQALGEALDAVLANDPVALRHLLRRRRQTHVWHRVVAREALRRGHEERAARLREGALRHGCVPSLLRDDQRELVPVMLRRFFEEKRWSRLDDAWPRYGAALSGAFEPLQEVGHMLTAAGRGAQAEPFFRAALDVRRDVAHVHGGLSVSLSAQNRPREAVDAALAGRGWVPGDSALAVLAGEALLEVNEPVLAEPHFRAALAPEEIDSATGPRAVERARAQAGLGRALARQGRAEEATAALRRAVELDPAAEAHGLALVALLRDTGATAEAMLACQALLSSHPGSEAARQLMAALAAPPPAQPEPPRSATAAQGGGFLARLLGRS